MTDEGLHVKMSDGGEYDWGIDPDGMSVDCLHPVFVRLAARIPFVEHDTDGVLLVDITSKTFTDHCHTMVIGDSEFVDHCTMVTGETALVGTRYLPVVWEHESGQWRAKVDDFLSIAFKRGNTAVVDMLNRAWAQGDGVRFDPHPGCATMLNLFRTMLAMASVVGVTIRFTGRNDAGVDDAEAA